MKSNLKWMSIVALGVAFSCLSLLARSNQIAKASGISEPKSLPSDLTKRVSNPNLDFIDSPYELFTQTGTSTAQCGNNVVVSYKDAGSLSELGGLEYSLIGYAVSTNRGLTFTDKKFLNIGLRPTRTFMTLRGHPVVACADAKTFYQASIFAEEMSVGTFQFIAVSRSFDGGATFGSPIFAAPRGYEFSTWVDNQWLTVDPTNRRRLYLTYTKVTIFPSPRIAIEIVRSVDGGETWSQLVKVADRPYYRGSAKFQGIQVIVGPQGQVYVAWQLLPPSGKPILKLRKSIDGGLSFGAYTTISSVTRVGNQGLLKGGIRIEEFPMLAVNRNTGELYATWNDGRRNSQQSQSGTYRYSDILFSRSIDGGATWSAPVRVNNNQEPTGSTLAGTDQYMPAIAVDRTGKIAICFYDRRFDPKNLLIDRVCATSLDKGVTWNNTRFTKISFPPKEAADSLYGLYDTLLYGLYDTLASDFNQIFPGFVGGYTDNTLADTAPDIRATKF
jgi:hypothetical protein